jgi:ADP-ribose pyrophosphatase YjhB (NUDIX family)
VGHELLLIPSVTIIVRDDQGRILLTKNSDVNLWLPIGGIVEPDESPRDAAVREMKEETGLLVEPVRIVGVYGGKEFRVHYPNGDMVSYVMTVYECRVVSGKLTPDHKESLELRYFSAADVESMQTSRWAKIVLRDAFK